MAAIDFGVIENFANGSRREHAVDIHREDDGDIVLTFGAGVFATDVIAALTELPPGAVFGEVDIARFCDDPDCEGADERAGDVDDDHYYPVMNMWFYVEEPAEATECNADDWR